MGEEVVMDVDPPPHEEEEDDDDEEMEERMNDDDDDRNNDENTPQNNERTPTGRSISSLSKSWSIGSAHVPTFTGGKVTHCHTTTTTTAPSTSKTSSSHNSEDDDKNDDDDDDNNEETKKHFVVPFLLLPVDGDLAIVDANRGVKLGTVRGGDDDYYDDADGDDNEDGVDQEAITSYALSHNDQFVVTCTRNHVLRQYAIHPPTTTSTTSSTSSTHTTTTTTTPLIELIKSWGRSGHTLPVSHMEFHSSNVFLATGSIDGTVRIWDVRGAYVTHVFRPVAGGDGGGSGRLGVTSLSWHPHKSQLILSIARDDGSMVIHDLRNTNSDQNVIILRDHVSPVTSMKWWGKEFFLSTGRDAILNLWRIVHVTNDNDDDHPTANNNNKKKKNKKNKNNKNHHHQGLVLNDVPKYNYRRIQTVPVYEQIEGMVLVPSSNPNELVVATAGSKGIVRLWKAMIVVGQTPTLELLQEQPTTQAFQEDRGGYLGLVLNETAAAIAAAAVIIDPKKKKKSGHSTTTTVPFTDEALIAIDAEHSLSFLSSELTLNRTIVGHNDEILDLKVIPSMMTATTTTPKVVVATNSPQLRIFELGNFSCTVLDGHSATVLCVEVSPCGRYIASCGKDKTMRVWRILDLDDGDDDDDDDGDGHGRRRRPICVATATGHTEAIGACGLSRKVGRYEVGGKAAKNGGGAFAVTASLDRTLKRWNLPGAEELVPVDQQDSTENNESSFRPQELVASVSVRGHEKDINIVSVAPNDSLVATGSQDKTVKLWKATDLTLKATLKGHKRGVWDCQFSPIDRVLATSSGDKTIKLWSLSDYSCVRTFQGHVASVLRVRFLTGGLQLMSAGADGLLKLWTIRTNECEATLDGHSDRVWALDLKVDPATNQSLLVSGGADSKLVVWEDNTQEVDEDKRAKEAETILLDQKLANHLRHKEFDKALEIALQVDKPHQALKVVTSIIEHDLQKKRQNGLSSLQQHVQGWTMERTAQVLKYCREWNTRALNCHVAMLVVKAIVTTIPADTLADSPGIPELLAGILPYAERHLDRLDKLYTSSYLLDFSLDSILGCLDPADVTTLQDSSEKDFESWQAASKLVLPPKHLDGRIQMGGKDIVGGTVNSTRRRDDDSASDDDDDDEVVTIGDSSTDESEDNASDDDDGDSSSDEEEVGGGGKSRKDGNKAVEKNGSPDGEKPSGSSSSSSAGNDDDDDDDDDSSASS